MASALSSSSGECFLGGSATVANADDAANTQSANAAARSWTIARRITTTLVSLARARSSVVIEQNLDGDCHGDGHGSSIARAETMIAVCFP